MSDDFEGRVHDAFHRVSLPAAPDDLVEALERVPDARVVKPRSRGASPLAALGLAAMLALGGIVALSVGQRSPGPVPPASVASGAPTTPAGSGGPVLGVVLDLAPSDGHQPTADELASVTDVIEQRMLAAGYGKVTISRVGETGLVVEIPSGVDADEVRRLAGQTGRIDFVPLGDQQAEPGDVIDLVENQPLFGGDQIESAKVAPDPVNAAGKVLELTLRPEAARLFADYTRDNIGNYFAIVVDGRAQSVPVIQSEIPSGQVQISSGSIGGFDEGEFGDLIAIIKSGQLPYALREAQSQNPVP